MSGTCRGCLYLGLNWYLLLRRSRRQLGRNGGLNSGSERYGDWFLDCLRLLAAFGFRRRLWRLMPIKGPQLECDVLVDGAGVGLFFGDPKLRQPVENLPRLDFELPRQLVDSNTLHK
jgi:hypothetical protein